MTEREYDARTCIVVVEIHTNSVGLVVDQVREVADIPEEQVEPPPPSGKGNSSHFLKGLGKLNDSIKIILNVEKLLLEEEFEILGKESSVNS